MEDLKCFVAVEFADDPNVAGLTYWYLCEFSGAKTGGSVIAPLGRHNNLQQGIIRKILFADEARSPYPYGLIKRVKALIKESEDVQNSK